MKTIYSLKEFHEKAVEISGVLPELVYARVQYGIHNKYEFVCYAHGYNMYFGNTMEESLAKMKEAIHPIVPPTQNIDVEIDILQETETI
jgi:hypothetical protein